MSVKIVIMTQSLLNVLVVFIYMNFILSNGQSLEHIVTDLEVIYGSYGVEIKGWYNETAKQDSDDILSSPGCPRSIDGYPWVYYGDPPKCFLAGQHGPCPFGEKLLIQRNSSFGVCACECLFDYDFSEQLLDSDRYIRCFRKADRIPPPNEQIYDKESKKCRYMYEQGPCENGTVIAKFTRKSLACLPFCTAEQNELQENDTCTWVSYVLSASSDIGSNQCASDDEHYSEVLRKCVKREHGLQIVVG